MSARQPDQSEHSAQPAHAALGDTASGSQPQARSRARHVAGPATIDLNQIARFLPRTGIGTDVARLRRPRLGHPHAPGLSGVARRGGSGRPLRRRRRRSRLLRRPVLSRRLGDLGSNFGTAEPRWKGASGTALLSEAARRVREAGFEIGNIAVQLVGERPRVAARSAEASRALSEAASARVSFTATTTDHLGFLGRTEGLLAVATALVYPVPDAVNRG